jgi:pimeloyl-ACP methyl ester carboxylesterase
MIVPDPCEASPACVRTDTSMSAHSAPATGRRVARALPSFFWRESAARCWNGRKISRLATRHRVYAFDMLGHGLTDKPQKNATALRNLPISP